MSKYILHFPEVIIPLESENRWLDAVNILYNQWKKNPTDEHNLVCVVMEAWYAMLELEYLETKYLALENMGYAPGNTLALQIESQKIYDIFCETVAFGFRVHSDSILFNMYVGYAAKTMPVHFVKFINDWEKTGLAMIRKAYLKDETDMLTRVFYYESIDHYSEEYVTASRTLWTTVSTSAWGNSSVQQHLLCVLDGDSSSTD